MYNHKIYEGKKGYDSEKVTEIVDLLYQIKTEYEDYDRFFDNINICKYCADGLRANKDVARSCFNRLFVIPTPDCIIDVNIFKRALITFCMTCMVHGHLSGGSLVRGCITLTVRLLEPLHLLHWVASF